MTVGQLREALASIPDHLPVHVAVNSVHENGGGTYAEYLFTLDCEVESFPTQGRMAVISINYDPK